MAVDGVKALRKTGYTKDEHDKFILDINAFQFRSKSHFSNP